MKDLTNKRFGHLQFLERAPNIGKDTHCAWKCRCDCGNRIIVNGASLRNGRTRSCGCFKLEMNAADILERRKKDIVEGTSLGRIQSSVISKKNTSGYKGVTRHSRLDKWVANIDFQGKRIYLSLFDDLDDAIDTRKKAEEIYYKPVIEKYKK